MENKRWKNGVRIEEVYGSFNNSQQADNILSIYHIHGYLPPFNEPFLSDGNEIVLSMEEYYDNVRNVYSWQTATQLHFLCHFTCIFVGISLSDINPQGWCIMPVRLVTRTRSISFMPPQRTI